jgi:hypothetical protein
MNKYSIGSGLIFGFLSGSVMLAAFLLGFPTKGNPFLTYNNIALIFLHSHLAIRLSRKLTDGEIVFKKAIVVGLVSTLGYVLVFSFFTMLYYFYINPNFADKYMVDIEISLKNSGLSQAEFQKQINEWKEDFLPMNQLLRFSQGMFIINLIIMIINSVILCKKD